MPNLISNYLGVHAQAMPLREQRMKLIASNLSNADTPGFQIAKQGVQPSIDGNTVDPDAERAAYGRAALEYRASLSFVESKVRSMLTAITGQ